ncbi:MAG: type I-U CRISPR-associated helicase/endonuclease Cas3, partial [Candidatus Bipolaricaulia bacterium]
SMAVRGVADGLRSLTPLGPTAGPLQLTRLRGGAELGQRPLEPSQPTIVFATVAMFASRWLFRGYGSSRSMRPVDAALAGIDTLILLDEAHLSRPLLDLARKLRECDIGNPATVIGGARSWPLMVSLTATGEPAADRFDLDSADLAHPIVQRRANAAKTMRLLDVSERALPVRLAASAVELLDQRGHGSSCIVFVNSPKLARQTAAEFQKVASKHRGAFELLLATGRMREREAQVVRSRLLADDGAPSRRDSTVMREHGLVVVATQTLEVGADLDFDLLVTETCGRRALVQRLGRLNRLGETSCAAGAIVHPTDRKSPGIYGEEPEAVWQELRAAQHDGMVDVSPLQLSAILGVPEDEPQRTAELLHAHLWEWAKTSLPPVGEAPVELFFAGFDEQRGRVSLFWRSHLPADGVRLFPGVRQSEVVEVPLWELRDALSGAETSEVRRLADDRASLETVSIEVLRPGDDVVLPVDLGLYDVNGWNPAAGDSVLDVSFLDSGVLLLDQSAVAHLAPGAPIPAALAGLSDLGEDGLSREEERDLVAELLGDLRTARHHPWLADGEWVGYLERLSDDVQRPIDDVPFLRQCPEVRGLLEIRAEAFEEMSFDVASLSLRQHHDAVASTAYAIASALGVDRDLVGSIREAARLHDLGKADPRFQRWLGADAGELLAKSQTPRSRIERERVAAGWPKGGRHELVSARTLATRPDSWSPEPSWDVDLIIHLVAAHHGWGRPLVPPVEDVAPPVFSVRVGDAAVEVGGGLGQTDWDQPQRFRGLCERYGYWGLALLEAILRQSDHVVSRAGGVS